MKIYVKVGEGSSVKMEDERTIELDVAGPQTSVAMIGKMIQELAVDSIPIAGHRFVSQGREMEFGNNEGPLCLVDYNIKVYSIINILPRCKYSPLDSSLVSDHGFEEFCNKFLTEEEKGCASGVVCVDRLITQQSPQSPERWRGDACSAANFGAGPTGGA